MFRSILVIACVAAGTAPIAAADKAADICTAIKPLASSAGYSTPFNGVVGGSGSYEMPTPLGATSDKSCYLQNRSGYFDAAGSYRPGVYCRAFSSPSEKADSRTDDSRFAPLRAARDELAEALKSCEWLSSWTYQPANREPSYSDMVEDHAWTDPVTGTIVAARAWRHRTGAKDSAQVSYSAGIAVVALGKN